MTYPNIFSKYLYYLSAIPGLLFKIRNPLKTIKLFFLPDQNSIKEIHLSNGLKFKLRYKMEIWTLKETIIDNCYLKGLPTLRENSIIIDVGAAFGDFCVWAAHQYPKSRVLAFEPQPASAQLAFENIQNNNITNVELRRAGISSLSKAESVHIAINAAPGSFSFLDAQAAKQSQPAEYQAINFVALSGILAELQVVDLLKIDCEGGEYDIILNSPKETFNKIRFLALEWHDNIIPKKTHDDIVVRLKECGFDVEVKLNPVHSYLGFIFAKNRLLTN